MKNLAKVVALVLIVAMFLVVLTACAPKDVASAKEKMEDAGYVVLDDNDVLKKLLGALDKEEGAVGVVMCAKGENIVEAVANVALGDKLVAVLFDSSSSAKEALKDYDGDTFQVIGKWVVAGTDDAIKAFK